jgi:AraC family transcriptional activator of mtrCDE
MLMDKLFENLELSVEPFATCRLADGWRLRLPRRDWVTLHYILDGDGELKLGSGGVFPLARNWLAVIPAGLTHSLQCGSVSNETGVEGQGDPKAPLCELVAGPLELLRLVVACGRVQASYPGGAGLFDHLNEAIVLDFDASRRMRGVFEALVDEYRRVGPASAAMMTALMSQCLIQVLRRVIQQADGALPWLSALDDPRLSRVVEAILSHPQKPHTLESLASVAHMSRAAFARHFRQCFGRTPRDYLRDVRLRRAAQLLRVGAMSVDRIASQVGFASRSHFSRAFKQYTGVSPQLFMRAERLGGSPPLAN